MEYLRQPIKETEEMKIEIDYNGAFAVCNIELMKAKAEELGIDLKERYDYEDTKD